MICRSYKAFFLNFANNTNLRIVSALRMKESNVTGLTKATGLEQSAVSHSLRNLNDCKIVIARREGRERYYSLNQETVVPLLALIERHVEKNCRRCDAHAR
jgi:DNA-binding transcriptional ArsR family regulator